MYSVDQSEQLVIFLSSLGIGFLLGILYDFLRAIKLAFTKGKAATVFFDILYFLLFAFLSYVFILSANKGEVRLYIIIGELLGAAFYYFSLGLAVIKITDVFVHFLKKLFHSIFKLLTYPFKLIHKLFSAVFSKISFIFKRNKKNSEKMQKKVLPKLRLYVYNLFGILCARKDSSQKGGSSFGSKEKEKTDQNI